MKKGASALQANGDGKETLAVVRNRIPPVQSMPGDYTDSYPVRYKDDEIFSGYRPCQVVKK
jgi:hypothetical protein